MLPALSFARTWNVWVRSESPGREKGLVQLEKPTPFRLHSKVAPDSGEEKEKTAVLELD